MKSSVRTRLLLLSVSWILICVLLISGSYFVLIKRDKHRESQARIKIGLDVVSDDLSNWLRRFAVNCEKFITKSANMPWVTMSYHQDNSVLSSSDYIVTGLAKIAESIRAFGSLIQADRVTLYGGDGRTLIVYLRNEDAESIGSYVQTEVGGKTEDTYVPMDNLSKLYEMFFTDERIPVFRLPDGVNPTYEGECPDTVVTGLFVKDGKVGIRVRAPVYHQGIRTAKLVAEAFITPAMVERYSRLSDTQVNIFAGKRLSVGTLPAQHELSTEQFDQAVAWDAVGDEITGVAIAPVKVDSQQYYQGLVTLRDGDDQIGAITVSLSQDVEKNEIKTALLTICVISAIVICGGTLAFVLMTRSSVRFVQKLIWYIDRMCKGDIPDKINEEYRGEFEVVRKNLNRLIETTEETSRIAEQIAAGDATGSLIMRSEHDRLMGALDSMNRDLEKRIDEKVSELRQTHEELKASEARLNGAQRIARMGDFIWDTGTGEVTWSEALFELLEYDPTEEIDFDRVNRDIHHPDDLERVTHWLSKSIMDGDSELSPKEYRLLRKGGEVIQVRTRGVVQRRVGKAPLVIGTVQDITDVKQAEEELQRSEARFRGALENIPDVIVIYDRELRIQYINAATLNISGRPASSFIGLRDDEVWEPEVYERYLPTLQKSLATKTVCTVETDLDLPEGGKRTVYITGVPLIDETGEVHEVVGITHDLTERKRAEIELARHRDRLEELVIERTGQLEDAHQQIIRQERLATLGQLTATVSHELRNPLGTVRSSVFSVREHVGELDSELSAILDRAERNVVRCDRIIEELLGYTRSREVVPVATLIDGWIEEVLEDQIIPHGVTVIKRLNSGIELPIDREKLRRCLINLVTNACQAMENSCARGGKLIVESGVQGDRLEIRVCDDGPGIPPEQLEKIFEPLYSTKGFGIGLGLAIVKQIAEAHHGGIEVSSVHGEGTIAKLWVPLEREHAIDDNQTGSINRFSD